MTARTLHLDLLTPDETAERAAALGERLKPADVVLLSGGVGAGKTHFARALIRSVQEVPEDIPSPTFTLVQIYETSRGTLWHSDLYRIGSVSEIEELGLAEAFSEAVCLVEWPDRLGDLRPEDALEIELRTGADEDERHLTARWQDPKWDDRLRAWAA